MQDHILADVPNIEMECIIKKTKTKNGSQKPGGNKKLNTNHSILY